MSAVTSEFDLQPDPRILPMLGEINLVQWRCIAELVDNAIDAFLDSRVAGGEVADPEILVQVPITDAALAKISVRDNGCGMSPEVLEVAVRAGWSGNDPINRLGMFGMGFNIATARLGNITTVWTTRPGDAEWIGLKIDFDELMKQKHFRTPRMSRPKLDPNEQGTEIVIERLKPEQREWFSRASNRSAIVRELSRAYSAMLRTGGYPIRIRLTVNGKALEGRNHCVWGDPINSPTRTVQHPRFGPVSALQEIDVRLADRKFCTKCWQWLSIADKVCPGCDTSEHVTVRQRNIRGWLGIQRYLHKTDYGIDLLRHGRKVELANRDLFFWSEEPEYPIDDPRNRGRIVGEIHLDHCRVSYTKDRFDRNDPAWDEMTKIVRGEGPLRPDKAADLAFSGNASALFKLFQVFRRSSPKPKVAGAYAKLLVVPDNDRAEEMAQRFHDGDPEFQSDARWWELVEEADKALLKGGGAGGKAATDSGGSQEPIPGFGSTEGNAPSQEPSQSPSMTAIPHLTGEYRSDSTNQRWNVHAFEVAALHAELVKTRSPWILKARPDGIHEFLVDTHHEVFASATMTPLDAILAQLAWSAMDFIRDVSRSEVTFASVLAELRRRYAASMALDPTVLSAEARQAVIGIASAVAKSLDKTDAMSLFSELSITDKESVYRRMAKRGIQDPQSLTSTGRFLEFVPPAVLVGLFTRHPELFFDGRCWDDAYAEIEYDSAAVMEEARRHVAAKYENWLGDAVWLAEQDPTDLEQASRERLLRAQLALDLLAPDVAEAAS